MLCEYKVVPLNRACSDCIGFFFLFSKLLRFWYHKNSYIFLIIILKLHALIPYRSEEKNPKRVVY